MEKAIKVRAESGADVWIRSDQVLEITSDDDGTVLIIGYAHGEHICAHVQTSKLEVARKLGWAPPASSWLREAKAMAAEPDGEIRAIKHVRTHTGLGLKQAKAKVDGWAL